MSAPIVDHLCLRISPLSAVFTVLGPFEKKGFEVVGMKSRGGGALIALRASPSAVAAGRALADKVRASLLPAGATLVVSSSATEALEWMHEALGNPREVVQWEPDAELTSWKDAGGDAAEDCTPEVIPFGAHNGNCESFRLSELLAPCAVGSALGARFCAQMRRDSYVPLVVTAAERKLLERVEEGATGWFAQDEDDKDEQGGAYGHVDRKFTGYRNGKFREQLEVRQTLDQSHGGVYPRPEVPAGFGDNLQELVTFLDGSARGLLRHIAVDVGADDGFFEV